MRPPLKRIPEPAILPREILPGTLLAFTVEPVPPLLGSSRWRRDSVRERVLDLRITRRAVVFVILQAVQVLVSLAACVAPVWFMFLHAYCPRVGRQGFRVDDTEGTVVICVEGLRVVAMLYIFI